MNIGDVITQTVTDTMFFLSYPKSAFRQEDQEFVVILSYLLSLRAAWAT